MAMVSKKIFSDSTVINPIVSVLIFELFNRNDQDRQSDEIRKMLPRYWFDSIGLEPRNFDHYKISDCHSSHYCVL